MTIGTRLYTWLKGELVGVDAFGHRYYQERGKASRNRHAISAAAGGRRRRWVIYNGEAEASRVPPEWHAWLHYTIDEAPGPDAGLPHRPWQKEHRPNPTGTAAAYRPPGHTLAGGKRDRATGDYEPWTPA
jgi:NADH:ubiquinone oxidoreductase subunit